MAFSFENVINQMETEQKKQEKLKLKSNVK